MAATTDGSDRPSPKPHHIPSFAGLVDVLSLLPPPSDITEGVPLEGTPVPNATGMYYQRVDTRPWGKRGDNNNRICDSFRLRNQAPPLHAQSRFASPYAASCGPFPNIRHVNDHLVYSCQLNPTEYGHLMIPAGRGTLNLCTSGLDPHEISQGLINDAALHYLNSIDPKGCSNFQASDVMCRVMTGTQAGTMHNFATHAFASDP